MPIYKDGVDVTVEVVRDHDLWISPPKFASWQNAAYPVRFESSKAQPANITEEIYLYANLDELPVDALLEKVAFYGDLGDGTSWLQFFVYLVKDRRTANPTLITKYDSEQIIGSSGHKSSIYEPSSALKISDYENILLGVALYATGVFTNARFFGCEIRYTY